MISFTRISSVTCFGLAIGFACSPSTSAPGDGDGDRGGDGDGDVMIGDGDGDIMIGDGDGGIVIGDGDVGGDGDGPLKDLAPTPNCAAEVDGEWLQDDEACDDGNQVSGDGCGANCRYIEPGFVCPTPGEACRNYAKCGDGVVVFPEQCDDGNVAAEDGCNDNCKIEVGFKCDGSPSVCGTAECGNGGDPEGAETCDDGNGLPFDGCSELCQGEPLCSEEGCTSVCGDGIRLVNEGEECDDGNALDGDGCSSTCKKEPGYECTEEAPCPEGEEDCPLDLPIVFRDFNLSHSDFQPPEPPDNPQCDGFAAGMVAGTLDTEGKPTFVSAPPTACVTNFNRWYVDSEDSSTILGSVRLFPNGQGGYVNRFGENGEPYVTTVDTGNESAGYGTSKATCDTTCTQRTRDSLQCDNVCRPEHDAVDQLTRQLEQAEDAEEPDEEAIEELEAEIELAQAEADECDLDCQTTFDTREADCQAACAPCSFNNDQWCIGGEQRELDGDPLFFPIDGHPDALMDMRYAARIPAQIYEAPGWPWEDCGAADACPNGTDHNFHFTSEIAYWFEYTDGMVADLSFVGDDDVWVFINRRLVIDLGGIHVPLGGRFTLNANGSINTRTWRPPAAGEDDEVEVELDMGTTSADALGLTPGKVYEIKVFHAERKPEGSSFQLTLSGFNASRSECRSICGDGILAAGEQCDNGKENNVGGHNGCTKDCMLGSYCGDGIVQKEEGETCDDADPEAPANCAGCRVIMIR